VQVPLSSACTLTRITHLHGSYFLWHFSDADEAQRHPHNRLTSGTKYSQLYACDCQKNDLRSGLETFIKLRLIGMSKMCSVRIQTTKHLKAH